MQSIFDVIIVGAGAAGLMAAIENAGLHLNVLLLDSRPKIGAKILMSGGTRCNVTNEKVSEKDFSSDEIRVVRNVLRAFPAEKAVKFFGDLGVELVLESDGKYFPSTHSGRTILEALTREAEKRGVDLRSGKEVLEVHREKNIFKVCGRDFDYKSKTVLLCTGGLSYPGTGSNGVGYEVAKSFGHHLIETTPSLTPLCTEDNDWKSLSGVSLPCKLTLATEKNKLTDYEGSFLFTHFGFSGPVVLNISRHWIREKDERKKIIANFLPQEEESEFRKSLVKTSGQHPKTAVKRFLTAKLPERFTEVILKKSCVDPNLVLNQLSSADRERIISRLFHYPLEVSGSLGYEKAEVTAGGINLREVDSKTLESKLQPSLFFAGEILDTDGRIGGFNFQWAWSSAVVAAQAIQRRLST